MHNHSDYCQSCPVGHCVATNWVEQGNTRTKPNTCSNCAPGDVSGADRSSDFSDNRDGRSRWNDKSSLFWRKARNSHLLLISETAENQIEPEPESSTPLEPAPEASSGSSVDMVYVPGFGWIESQDPNQVEYAEDMYENRKKIGIMG